MGFGSIPVVRGVRGNGPAAGKLQAGDSIVTIAGTNGQNAIGPFEITSPAAFKLFAGQQVGTPLRFGIRRNGKSMEVTVIPVEFCHQADPDLEKALAAKMKAVKQKAAEQGMVVGDFAVPLQDAALAPEANMKIGGYLFPAGWFGFSIRCVDCIALPTGGKDVMFRSAPSVNRVEQNSPAEKAGLRSGDVLTQIDGVLLASEEGTTRFRSVKPGQTVRFRFTRDGKAGDLSLQAIERPDLLDARKAAAMKWPADNMEKTRYKGLLGDVSIEAFGAPVSVKETDDEIIIESKMLVVRLKKVAKGAKAIKLPPKE
jgi:S1-C subfamily serine protease